MKKMEALLKQSMVHAKWPKPENEEPYLPEETLVEQMQRGECSWIDYVRLSAERREEYSTFCASEGYDEDNHSAYLFVSLMERLAELAIMDGRL